MDSTHKTINHKITGLLFWFLTCLLGSFIVVSIERYKWNQIEGHFMTISGLILIGTLLTLIALISSAPTIVAINYLSRKTKNLGLLITTSFLLTFAVGFFVVLYLSKSVSDTLQILSPFFLLSFAFQCIFLKIVRSYKNK